MDNLHYLSSSIFYIFYEVNDDDEFVVFIYIQYFFVKVIQLMGIIHLVYENKFYTDRRTYSLSVFIYKCPTTTKQQYEGSL
jgi:hypothetical protein